MSCIIAVHVNEGIVLASDRRTTYNTTQKNEKILIQRIGIHTTNSTDKTFLCPNGAGISTCGDASLADKPMTGYIREMIRTKVTKETPIESMPHLIIEYFNTFPETPDTHFIIAGYNSDGCQQIYRVFVKPKEVIHDDTSSQGAIWDGEVNTLTRLLQNVAIKQNGQYTDLPYENVLWNYFTLQDAIDFAQYAVGTTIQTMRFKNVVETVGGAIDILLITPEETKWLKKEMLSY